MLGDIVPKELQALALHLFSIGAIKTKEMSDGGKGFKLKLHERYPDAPLSPIKVMLKLELEEANTALAFAVRRIGDHLADLIKREEITFDYIAGVPNGGAPIARRVAYTLNKLDVLLPLVKEEYNDGTRKIVGIRGQYAWGATVLLVEDVATEATSISETVHVLRTNGLQVRDVCVVVDREQGAEKALNMLGVRMHPLFKILDLFYFYRQKEKISQLALDQLRDYLGRS